MSKPPLELHVEVTDAAGASTRWDPGDQDASLRPQDITFTTQRMTGFGAGACTLTRRIDRDYVDLNLFDNIAFIGHDGSIAYDGRISGQPRSMDATHSITVNAAGWMAHAADRRFTQIYVDRDLSGWRQPAAQRTINLRSGTPQRAPVDHSVDADTANGQSALATRLTGAWTAVTQLTSEPWYDAGPGNQIGSISYAWKRGPNVADATIDANWVWAVLLSDDDVGTNIDNTGDLQAAGPGTGTLSANGDRRYAFLQFYYNAAGGGDGSQWDVFWTVLAVYGDHGLTKRGDLTSTDAPGLWASDVIRHVASSWCPKLDVSGVQDTSYPIPHLAFRDRTTPYEAFLRCNAFHLWELAVWENRVLTYRPLDLETIDWQVKLSDFGTSVSLQGDNTDDLANGIAVQFQNLATGAQDILTPDDSVELADPDPGNPANQHGIRKWIELQLSAPTTRDAAVQLGRAKLAEHNTPKSPGSITTVGHIRDGSGSWQPGWKVRAGDTIAIVDHPNNRPRLISETQWNQDSKQLTVSLEGQPLRLDAILDRIDTSLDAAGLK